MVGWTVMPAPGNWREKRDANSSASWLTHTRISRRQVSTFADDEREVTQLIKNKLYSEIGRDICQFHDP